MESWWAERSISAMINEKSLLNTRNNSNEINPIVDNNNNNKFETQLNENIAIINNNLKYEIKNNSLDSINKTTQYKFTYTAAAKSIMPTYQNFNSIHLCFT